MYEYLKLSLEEREEMEELGEDYPIYLVGEGHEFSLRKIQSQHAREVIRKVRYSNQTLRLFDFYLEKRQEGEIFNSSFFKHRKDKDEMHKIRTRMLMNARYNFSELEDSTWEQMITLASEVNPKIKEYTTLEGVFRIEAPLQLLRLFEYYLAHRREHELFNSTYLLINKNLNKRFHDLGTRLYSRAKRYLSPSRKNGLDLLIELAAEVNPEIKKYRESSELLKVEGTEQLIKMFDAYLVCRKEGDRFTPHYLKENESIKKQFGNLGQKLLGRCWRFLGIRGFDHLVELASEKRPEIKNYRDRKQLLVIEGAAQLLKIFNFYLEERAQGKLEGVVFSGTYVRNDPGLKQQFGNLGSSIFQKAEKNLSDSGGFQRLLKVASETDVRTRNYQDRKSLFVTEAVPKVIEFFDVYLQEREQERKNGQRRLRGLVFWSQFLREHEAITAKFGKLGMSIYDRACSLLDGGFSELLSAASRERPIIVEYSRYRELFKIEGREDLIQAFDFYLQNRKDGEILNYTYLAKNILLNKALKNLGKSIVDRAQRNLCNEGGLSYLVQLAAQQRPEILHYWKYSLRSK